MIYSKFKISSGNVNIYSFSRKQKHIKLHQHVDTVTPMKSSVSSQYNHAIKSAHEIAQGQGIYASQYIHYIIPIPALLIFGFIFFFFNVS